MRLDFEDDRETVPNVHSPSVLFALLGQCSSTRRREQSQQGAGVFVPAMFAPKGAEHAQFKGLGSLSSLSTISWYSASVRAISSSVSLDTGIMSEKLASGSEVRCCHRFEYGLAVHAAHDLFAAPLRVGHHAQNIATGVDDARDVVG